MEVVWFVLVLNRPVPPLHAGLLAVYGGKQSDRDVAGWALEKKGDFDYLAFSDAGIVFVTDWNRQFGPPKRAKILLEPDARTTAQNARFVARLIRDHDIKSVMVLTSWWHLPRALFLTKLALMGQGVRVDGIAVGSPVEQEWKEAELWMELLRFWGSLVTFDSDKRHHTQVLLDSKNF